MSKRNDPNRKRVKEQLFKIYGCTCMVCQKKFTRQELTLHHISKWEHTHKTTIEQSSLVCEQCHHQINEAERNNTKEYNRLNNKIREYKKGRG
jgi:5-methylcytosine-specific restriction endonuclease McrA